MTTPRKALRSIKGVTRRSKAGERTAIFCLSAGLFGAFMLVSAPLVNAAESAAHPDANVAPVVAAKVNGEEISWHEFVITLRRIARERFYHGSVPTDKIGGLRKDVINLLIDRRLMLAEAKRRGIGADQAAVKKNIESLDQRYQGNPDWAKRRKTALPLIERQLLDDSVIKRLEDTIRKVPKPTSETIKAFFDANPDLFTEPMQERVAVILLGVDASAQQQQWKLAEEESQRLSKRLIAGADFKEMAKMHSSHESAKIGGDMGYLHRGMLAPTAQDAIDKLDINGVSLPVQLLQGFALFQLIDRKAPVKRQFEEVAERASALFIRQQSNKKWEEIKKQLKDNAEISIDAAVHGQERKAPVTARE